ncbi:MAG: hypothetical protein BGP09_31360 [Rhizobium sp. 60-20]|nr:MAG: hypothetical protein BGP09_31360 [Rhizobium sp. 60-20]
MQIEATRFQSQAEMVAEARARRKRFEIAGRLAAMKKIAPLPTPEPEKERITLSPLPLWSQFGLNFDAHVVEWHLRRANPALTYVKDRCNELGWTFSTIVGPQRRRPVVRVRQKLMWEVSEKFNLSLPQIGRMFGGRDHTTVLHAIRKVEADTPRAAA